MRDEEGYAVGAPDYGIVAAADATAVDLSYASRSEPGESIVRAGRIMEACPSEGTEHHLDGPTTPVAVASLLLRGKLRQGPTWSEL